MPGEIKTIQNAWAVITEFEYLCEADHNARKGKRYRQEILAFTAAFEHNLFVIQAQMQGGTYILGPYRKLWVFVPKKRLVMALRYPDRIVQWSLYQYLNPIYDKLFIEDSYACRKDKGSHKAAQRLQYWMRQVSRKPDAKWYYLKLDISKFFYRVNHAKLLEILSRRIKDPELMRFLDSVINSRAEAFGLPRGKTPQDTPPEEWLWMAVVCLFGGVFIGALALVRLGYSVVVAKAAYKWICWAEENVIGSKMGEEKKKQVIKALRDLTPDWLDWAINEKFLDFFVELIFKVTKSKLEAYMEKKSKETATVARFGKAGEDNKYD